MVTFKTSSRGQCPTFLVWVYVSLTNHDMQDTSYVIVAGSLGSRPSQFRARFNYAHVANIRSKLFPELAANVYRMRIMKTCTERGRPGTEAKLQGFYHSEAAPQIICG